MWCKIFLPIAAIALTLSGCAGTSVISSPSLRSLEQAGLLSSQVEIENRAGATQLLFISSATLDGIYDEQGHFYVWSSLSISKLKRTPQIKMPVPIKVRLVVTAKCLVLVPMGILVWGVALNPFIGADMKLRKSFLFFEGAALGWCADSWTNPIRYIP